MSICHGLLYIFWFRILRHFSLQYSQYFSLSFIFVSSRILLFLIAFDFVMCNGDHADRELCSRPGTSISITSITAYVQSDTTRTCGYDLGDCHTEISDTDSSLYQDISESCNGKRACTDLVVGAERVTCNNVIQQSDYVRLTYSCVQDDTLSKISYFQMHMYS